MKVPVGDDTLQRYRLLHTGDANSLPDPWVLSEKAPVDRDYDSHLYVGPARRVRLVWHRWRREGRPGRVGYALVCRLRITFTFAR